MLQLLSDGENPCDVLYAERPDGRLPGDVRLASGAQRHSKPMTSRSVLKMLLAGVLATSAITSATAGDDKKKEHDVIRDALRRGEVLPLTKVLAIAAQRVPGDIVEVELEDDDDRALVYEIKILTDAGRVREIKIDARTGAVLEIEDD